MLDDPANLDEEDLWAFHEVDVEVAERVALLGSPCPVCGETDACDFDPEGRALIHVVVDSEDE